MKINAMQRYRYQADLYDFTTDDPSTDIRTYFPYGLIKFHFANDPNAPRVVILSKQPIKRGMMLTKIRDANGDLFMGEAQYTITSIEAVLTYFGTIEGYRHQAALSRDPDFDDIYGEGGQGGGIS